MVHGLEKTEVHKSLRKPEGLLFISISLNNPFLIYMNDHYY